MGTHWVRAPHTRVATAKAETIQSAVNEPKVSTRPPRRLILGAPAGTTGLTLSSATHETNATRAIAAKTAFPIENHFEVTTNNRIAKEIMHRFSKDAALA